MGASIAHHSCAALLGHGCLGRLDERRQVLVGGLNPGGFLVVVEGAVRQAALIIHEAERLVGLRVVGHGFEDFPEHADGFIIPAHACESQAEGEGYGRLGGGGVVHLNQLQGGVQGLLGPVEAQE